MLKAVLTERCCNAVSVCTPSWEQPSLIALTGGVQKRGNRTKRQGSPTPLSLGMDLVCGGCSRQRSLEPRLWIGLR